MVRAEIDHTEIDPNACERIAVIIYKGKDWEGDRTDRIGVPLNAGKEKIKEIARKQLDSKLYAKEVASRTEEIREAMGDPSGEEIEPSLDAKKEVDKLVEYLQLDDGEKEELRSKSSSIEEPGEGKPDSIDDLEEETRRKLELMQKFDSELKR